MRVSSVLHSVLPFACIWGVYRTIARGTGYAANVVRYVVKCSILCFGLYASVTLLQVDDGRENTAEDDAFVVASIAVNALACGHFEGRVRPVSPTDIQCVVRECTGSAGAAPSELMAFAAAMLW